MKAEEYEVILNSLPSTGVYVIKESDHSILYFNRFIKEMMPEVKTGMICHEVWRGSCKSCPLRFIEGKKESKVINCDNPLGCALDLTAVRVQWEDTIPAFVVTITPHIEMADYSFHKVLRGNLTDDSFEAVKIEEEERKLLGDMPHTLSEYLGWFAGSPMIYEEDQERLRKFSALESLRKNLKNRKNMVGCSYRKKLPGGYRWHTLEIVPDFQYTDDWQSVMIYTKDVHDVYQEGLERQEVSLQKQERLAAIIRSQYDVMNIIHLSTGKCERIYLNEGEQPGKVITGDYEHHIQQAVKYVIYEKDRKRFQEILGLQNLRKKAEQVDFFREEIIQYRVCNHTVRWVEEHIFYIRQKGHIIVSVLGKDITKEKFLEEQTSAEQKRRALIIGSLSSLFFSSYYVNLSENTFQAVSQNREVGEVLGDKQNYMEGIRTYAEKFVHPDEREEYLKTFHPQNLAETLSEKHPCVAMEYRKLNGGYSYVKEGWVRANMVLSDEENGCAKTALYVAQDVTESKFKEEQDHQILREAYEAAKQANTSKSDFLSRMSHDIRTPMNAIIGMTMIAGAHLDDSDRVRDCLNKITVSSRHLLSLVNEVLDMSKIESGKISLAEEGFYLSDLIQNLLTIVRPAAKGKQQELRLHVVNVEHEYVIGDQMRMQQVFVNILGNSVKYTPPGGILELEITEKSSEEYGYGCYEFVFRDNGIGMEEEFVKKIFEPFSRAEDSRVSKIEGTGLGMAIAQNIVHMMNGTIQVESEKNKGSQFTVTLFLKQKAAKVPDLEMLEGKRVLVADDDACICESVCEMLEDMGMEAVGALSGEEAIECFERDFRDNKTYFAVLTDWNMPGLDGLDVAKAICSRAKEKKPVVILAAYDWSNIEEDGRKAGIDDFITKPLFKSHLIYLFRRLAGISEPVNILAESGRQMLSFEGSRILLAEDNELNREIAEELIGDTQVELETAEDGQEAVQMYEAQEAGYYDLIFMDIQMPRMNGYEASRAIRASAKKDAKTIPIIAMTANAFAEDVIESQKAGMNEHISKPLDLDQLMKCMSRWLKK